MSCAKAQCSNQIIEGESCPQCIETKYCSRSCRQQDWEQGHQPRCGQLQMQDYEEEKDPMLRVLGKGAYGEVLLVRHRQTKQLYALKTIEKVSIERHVPMKAVLREINIQSSLNHKHIIRLYRYWQDDVKLYLLLEFAPRGSLFHEVRRKRGLTEDQAWKFFTQTALGIKYLHDNQIAHRDLKPENLLLNDNGDIKIADFGWCVQGSELRNTFCGTLDYMAPEMLQQKPYSFSVDIWALGVLLYELCHGYAPFRATKDSEKCNQILYSDLVFKSKISLSCQDLVTRLLKKEPSDRLDMNGLLRHQWIQKYMPASDLKIGSKVKFNESEGVVTNLEGFLANVRFTGNNIKILEINQLEKLPDEGIGLGLLPDNGQKLSIMRKEQSLLGELENWCKVPVRRGRRKVQVDFPVLRSNSLQNKSRQQEQEKFNDDFEISGNKEPEVTQKILCVIQDSELDGILAAQIHLEEQYLEQQDRVTIHKPVQHSVNQRQRQRPSRSNPPLIISERLTQSRMEELQRLTQEIQPVDPPNIQRKNSEVKRPARNPPKPENSFWDIFSCLSRS